MENGPPVRFGIFDVDVRAGELRRSGTRVRIQEQPFRVLTMLLERPGEIVTRDEIKQALWPGDEFGDFDHAINVAVKKLRDALGDDADNPRFVETMARRGYRFIAPVDGIAQPTGIQEGAVAPPETPAALPIQKPKLLPWIMAAALVVLFAVAALILWHRPGAPLIYTPIQLSTMQGMAQFPAFSPDGNEIAFQWNHSAYSKTRIYLQAVGSTTAHPLTNDPAVTHDEGKPRWWPDGHGVLYVRSLPNEADEIWTVDRTGGAPRKLLTSSMLIRGFDVAPDGKALVISESRNRVEPLALFLISLTDMRRSQLTWPPASGPSAVGGQNIGDSWPAFAPGGKRVAFLREGATGEDLWLVPTMGGNPQRMTEGDRFIFGQTWVPDERSLLLATALDSAGRTELWRFWIKDKRWEHVPVTANLGIVPGGLNLGVAPSLSLDGHRLAFIQYRSHADVWRIALPTRGHAQSEPLNLTDSISENVDPIYSPAGSHFVFVSNRTGHWEIYVAQSDGSNVVQLTSFNGNDAGSPRWSPDGNQITFDFRPGAHAHIFVVDSNGGPPRQLTFGDTDNIAPRFSHDGQWIYFARERRGGTDIWKLPAGGGQPVFVSPDGCMCWDSADGQTLYYSKLSQKDIYARPLKGGEEHVVIRDALSAGRTFFVEPGGIYYLASPKSEAPNVAILTFFDFASGQSKSLMPAWPSRFPNFGISPDHAWLIIDRMERRSDVMLVENFRP